MRPFAAWRHGLGEPTTGCEQRHNGEWFGALVTHG
jgi:hypothetical protein